MKPDKRQALLVGVMLLMMLVAAGWLTMGMLDHRRNATHAAEDLANSRALAGQIKSLRGRSAMASELGDASQQERRLAEQVNAAAQQAGLTGQWQQGIEHRRETRVDDTPYLRKPAVLLTRGLTLAELTSLLHHLTYDSAYCAEQVQLRTPPGEDVGNRWDADITLTYLIYSPQETQGQGR